MRSLARLYAGLVPCFLANTVVFLPAALHCGTRRNAIQLSRFYKSILFGLDTTGIPSTHAAKGLAFIPAHECGGLLARQGNLSLDETWLMG